MPRFGVMVEYEHAVSPRAGEDTVTMHDERTQRRVVREAVAEVVPFQPLFAPASEATATGDVEVILECDPAVYAVELCNTGFVDPIGDFLPGGALVGGTAGEVVRIRRPQIAVEFT